MGIVRKLTCGLLITLVPAMLMHNVHEQLKGIVQQQRQTLDIPRSGGIVKSLECLSSISPTHQTFGSARCSLIHALRQWTSPAQV